MTSGWRAGPERVIENCKYAEMDPQVSRYYCNKYFDFCDDLSKWDCNETMRK